MYNSSCKSSQDWVHFELELRLELDRVESKSQKSRVNSTRLELEPTSRCKNKFVFNKTQTFSLKDVIFEEKFVFKKVHV